MNEFLSAIFSFRKSVIWQLLAELSGVVSSIIFIIIGASFLINIVREGPLFLAIILVLFVLAIIFLLKLFKTSIKKAAIELEGKRTRQEISSKEIVAKNLT